MAHEMGTDLQGGNQEVVASEQSGFVVSPISQGIQEVGHRLMASGKLVEVDEDVLSTCQEPISNFGERLLRARDTGIPLVEVTLFPDSGNDTALKDILGIQDRPVRQILRSDGVEQNERFWGDYIRFTRLGLSIPGVHAISLDGTYGKELTAVLESGKYIDYSEGGRTPSRGPSFSLISAYEGSTEPLLACPPGAMEAVLDKIAEDYDTATEGVDIIEGTAVEEVPEDRHLSDSDH